MLGKQSAWFLWLMVLVCSSSLAANRGLSVKYKDNESADAVVAGEVQLYTASHALVIGIDDYRNGWPRLSNAVSDAQKIADSLRGNGFEVTLRTNLTGSDLELAFEDFFIDKGANPDARLLVWFAGHGHTVDGEGYLIPADGVPESDRRNFLRRSISLRDFGKYSRLAEAKHVYTIFDSCFAGTIFNVARSAPPPAITRVTIEPVRQFLTSGDAGQQVSDDGTFASLFVEALEGRRRADLNADGYLTGEELGGFLTNQISNFTNNAQVPRYGKLRDPRFNRGDFVFEVGAANLPVTQPAQLSNPASSYNPEDELWRVIKSSSDRADYDVYLSEYPNGKYAAVARIQQKRLADQGLTEYLGDVQIRLFEGSDDAPDYGNRSYTTRFRADRTRRIWIEATATNNDRTGTHNHSLRWEWLRSDGVLEGHVDESWSVQTDWETTWNDAYWGWRDPGNWPRGQYKARVIIDGKVFEQVFEVY